MNLFLKERISMRKSKQIALHKKAQKAMREAVRKVVEEHRKSGIPLAVWRNGKVMTIAPSRIKLN